MQIAVEQNLTAARLTGIGALSRVVLRYLDLEKREYRHIEIDQQVEVLSLIGDFALHDAEKKAQAHIVVGKSAGTAHGGHLLKGWMQPTYPRSADRRIVRLSRPPNRRSDRPAANHDLAPHFPMKQFIGKTIWIVSLSLT